MRVIMSTEEMKQQFPHGVTKPELAAYYELENFDTAIPQVLYDQLAAVDDFMPWGHYVTYYPEGMSFGCIFPLTCEGEDHMAKVFKGPFTDPRIGNTHED